MGHFDFILVVQPVQFANRNTEIIITWSEN